MARNIQQIGQVVQSTYHRDSEQRNRVYVEEALSSFVASTSTPTVLYTVTAGKTLYVKSINISIVNDGSVTGELHINDNSTLKEPLLATAKNVGVAAVLDRYNIYYGNEPKLFNNNVEIIAITSTGMNVTISITGYEE